MSNAPIVIVGGATWWPNSYRDLANTLRDISGSEVHVAPITPLDWTLGYFKGFGQLVFEVASTVDRALLGAETKRAVLVGHSAGGLACRGYIGGAPPYGGRRDSGRRGGGGVGGDGVVPVEAALLPGSEEIVLDGVHHNGRMGLWYGSDAETVGRWWPEALRADGGLREVRAAERSENAG